MARVGDKPGPAADRYQLWRLPEVVRRTGVCRSTIYNLMREGRFPRPRAVGGNSVAWWSGDLIDWMEALPMVGLAGDKASDAHARK